jgi:hypothetical protein
MKAKEKTGPAVLMAGPDSTYPDATHAACRLPFRLPTIVGTSLSTDTPLTARLPRQAVHFWRALPTHHPQPNQEYFSPIQTPKIAHESGRAIHRHSHCSTLFCMIVLLVKSPLNAFSHEPRLLGRMSPEFKLRPSKISAAMMNTIHELVTIPRMPATNKLPKIAALLSFCLAPMIRLLLFPVGDYLSST